MTHPLIENLTPFAMEPLFLADEEGVPLLVPVVKATYLLHGSRLTLAEHQAPVNLSGTPWGSPGDSSYRYEPECSFTKVATDVVLAGHAHAPRAGTTELQVALRVGPVERTLRVLGERVWFKSLGRISMTKPLAFERMPLVWERAFGGWDRSAEDSRQHSCEPRNPVGVGFRASARHYEEGLRLPNLEEPEHPLREFGQVVPPAGFGFTSPQWQPRASYAGTYDEAWERTRSPLLPRDFDRRFFNAAPKGLVAPGYLRGDEPVLLLNVSPQARLTFSLPGQPPPRVTVTRASGKDERLVLRLDTLILDLDANRLFLLWRNHLALQAGAGDVSALIVTAETPSPRKDT